MSSERVAGAGSVPGAGVSAGAGFSSDSVTGAGSGVAAGDSGWSADELGPGMEVPSGSVGVGPAGGVSLGGFEGVLMPEGDPYVAETG
ncbi:hypothetical protein [Streptomyces venezuelae]|uniref:hypothetical protein n=1 Tax=Streptomyces venezuelae TaxID=54571 RepID=UPI0012393B59|nr:hypothetical protein [Streptomyces venezuelae]